VAYVILYSVFGLFAVLCKERLTPLKLQASLGSRCRLALQDKDSIVWSLFSSLVIIAFDHEWRWK